MPQVRATEKSLLDRKAAISRYKAEVNRLEDIQKERESSLWQKYLAPSLKASIAANQSALDDLLDAETKDVPSEHTNAKALRAAIRAYQNIYNEVEHADKAIAQKRAAIERIAEEVARIEREGHITEGP